MTDTIQTFLAHARKVQGNESCEVQGFIESAFDAVLDLCMMVDTLKMQHAQLDAKYTELLGDYHALQRKHERAYSPRYCPTCEKVQTSARTNGGKKCYCFECDSELTSGPLTFQPESKTVINPHVTTMCMSVEGRDLLDTAIAQWVEFKGPTEEQETAAYSFAYWLIRYSGLVMPAKQVTP